MFFRLVQTPGQVSQPLGWIRVQELGYNVPRVLVFGLWRGVCAANTSCHALVVFVFENFYLVRAGSSLTPQIVTATNVACNVYLNVTFGIICNIYLNVAHLVSY